VHYLFEPGLFGSGPVRTALLVGAVVAVTSGIIGVFTVLRGQSFAGHSLSDVATTGGSGAFLVGVNQFWGFLVAGVVAAALMEGIGVQRRRGRDVATGVVLGAALGLAALFLYLGTLHTATTGASFTVLFGSIFVISPDTVPALIASGAVALLAVAALARVLLLTAVSPDLARARGVNVRLVGIGYLAALAVSVSLSAVAIGAVLSTALLIGPAATALRLTKSPARAMAASALAGLAATWLGIVLAYDSYYWPPYGHGWPVSFFVVVFVLAGYLLSYLRPRRPRAPRSPHEEAAADCGPGSPFGGSGTVASFAIGRGDGSGGAVHV
jgi:zinc/manganese transport system permease protein